ncbi:hypothetical protein LY76DRAFT_463610, partial [Colletotrichum caudatum]
MADEYDCKSINYVVQERHGGTRAGGGTVGGFDRQLPRSSRSEHGRQYLPTLPTLACGTEAATNRVVPTSNATTCRGRWASAAACRGTRSKASTASWLAALPTGTPSGE